MSADLVRVTIDEKEVHVPKGTGMVETAQAAGIEIPVFCYEPRLGAPVGACRMCLVEVEGMPKLQAGCTLTAQDGMVVKTAQTSARAAQGQLDLLLDVCDRILGKCLCPLGDADAMAVAGFVDKFRDDFQAHIDQGGCPFGGESSIEGLLAPSDQHAHHPVAEIPS